MDELEAIALAAAAAKNAQPAQRNADGTYGTPPEGMFLNPETGQMTSRDLLRANANVSPSMAALSGGMQGTGFGFGDEMMGAIGALQGGEDMARFRREQARATIEANREAHPYITGGSEVAGAVASAIPAASLASGKSLLGTMARGSGLGAVEGAMHGAGRGEGLEGRARQAGTDAALGAAIGGAAPAVLSGAKGAYRAVADPIGGAFNVGNSGRANRALASVVEKSGVSVDDVADQVARAAQEGQPEYRVMDALGVTGQRRAAGLTRAGGDSGDALAEFLSQRQADQGDRVAGFVDEAFDMKGKSAKEITDYLTDARGIEANAAYSAARGNAAPVDVRGAVSIIDDRIAGMQGVDIKGDGIDAKLAGFRNRLISRNPQKASPGGTTVAGSGDGAEFTSVELSDFDRVLGVKQDVQDAIGTALRAGRNNEARELGKLESALDAALEGSSDMYRAANDGFREASRVIGAVDAGANMANPARRAVDTTAEFRNLTPQQQAAARIGYGDRALAKLEANAAPTANKAKPFSSTKATEEAREMAVLPDLFRDRIARENAMWETQNRALGGSRTADNMADMAATEANAADVGSVMRSAANLQLGDAVASAGRLIAPAFTGQNEATRRLMVEALLSRDPRAALGPAMRSRGAEVLRQRLAEAIARNSARPFTQ